MAAGAVDDARPDRWGERVIRIRKVQENELVPPQLRRLISPGVTMGGARPKALLNIAGEQWVIKFADGEPTDTPLVEHAAMTLAQKADIRAAPRRTTRSS